MKLNSLGFFDIGSFFGKIFKSPPQQNAAGKSGKPSVGPPPPMPSLSDSSPGLSSALSAKGIFGRAPARQSSAKQLVAPGGSQAAAGSPIAARLGTQDQLHGASSSSPSSSPSQISTAGIIAGGGGSPAMVWPASGANTVSTLSPAAASQHQQQQQQRLSPRFARPASVGARAEAHGGSDRFLVTVGIGRAPPLPVPPYGLPDIHEEDFLPRMYEQQQHHHHQQHQQHQQQRHIHDSRGLARGGVDQPPLPEPAGNALPLAFSQHMQHAISAYNRSSSLESSESSGNTTPTELDKSWSAIHSDTTCPSTEQSSLFSWGDDEFERVASRRVQQLFREIDALLYEGTGSAQTPALQGECMQWKTRFLHLRILGKQLVEPTDEGYQLVPTEGTAAARTEPPTGSVSTGHNPSGRELRLQGSRLVPRGALAGPSRGGAVSPAAQSHRDNGSGGEEGEEGEEVAQETEEEVICRDGTVEEVLAFDRHEPEEDVPEWRHSGGNRCGAWRARRGLPPVSPAACLRDAVCTELFDQLWAEALGCLHSLDQQSWDAEEKGLTGVERPAMQRILLPRQASTADSLSMPPSRGSDTRSYLPQLHRTSLSGRPGDLHGVMMIQAKPLQQRHGPIMDKLPLPSALEERMWSGRPASSVLSLPRSRAGPRPAAAVDDALPAFSRVALSSARRRPHPAAGPRLDARAKTSSVNRQEVLRGTRLAMGASERLSTPQMSAVRNTLLPPIGSPDPHESQLTVPGARPSQTKGRLSISRVSSAVTDDTGRRPARDRPSLVLEHPSRPNTTHTFRSDMQLRRSLTPMEYNSATRTGRASLGSDSLKIRVTGIGLSSAGYQLDPFSLHALGHSPLEDDEDHPPAYHPSWGAESHLHHKPQSRSSNGKKRFPMAL